MSEEVENVEIELLGGIRDSLSEDSDIQEIKAAVKSKYGGVSFRLDRVCKSFKIEDSTIDENGHVTFAFPKNVVFYGSVKFACVINADAIEDNQGIYGALNDGANIHSWFYAYILENRYIAARGIHRYDHGVLVDKCFMNNGVLSLPSYGMPVRTVVALRFLVSGYVITLGRNIAVFGFRDYSAAGSNLYDEGPY